MPARPVVGARHRSVEASARSVAERRDRGVPALHGHVGHRAPRGRALPRASAAHARRNAARDLRDVRRRRGAPRADGADARRLLRPAPPARVSPEPRPHALLRSLRDRGDRARGRRCEHVHHRGRAHLGHRAPAVDQRLRPRRGERPGDATHQPRRVAAHRDRLPHGGLLLVRRVARAQGDAPEKVGERARARRVDLHEHALLRAAVLPRRVLPAHGEDRSNGRAPPRGVQAAPAPRRAALDAEHVVRHRS